MGSSDFCYVSTYQQLGWLGQVLRKTQGYVGNRCLNLPALGKRPRGRPKTHWIDIAESDIMRANGLQREDAQDRAKWRKQCRKADPGRKGDCPLGWWFWWIIWVCILGLNYRVALCPGYICKQHHTSVSEFALSKPCYMGAHMTTVIKR